MATLLAGQGCSSSEETPAPGEDASHSHDASTDPDVASPKQDTGPDTTARDVGSEAEASADVAAETSADAPAEVGDDGEAGSGGCTTDMQCSAPTPRCHVPTRTCVACLTGSTDNCPSNQYCDANTLTCKPGCKTNTDCTTGVCSADHACVECTPGPNDACAAGKYCGPQFSCIPGCKNDAACASGKCLATHDCSNCLTDQECAAGRLCSTGQCLATCTSKPDCPTGFECCGNRCADTKRDWRYCGACGTACTDGQFCSTSCKPAIVSNLCESPVATLLLDGLSIDDAATMSIQTGILASCAPPPNATSVPQMTSGVINPTTGKPVAWGGNMLVIAGGPYGQLLVKYLENAGITPIYNHYDSAVDQILGRKMGDAGADPYIVNATQSQITESHSYFLVETVVDPPSGTLSLIVYGISASGTQAAAWYFVNKLLPIRATLTKAWYVYEWTDGDADMKPGDADTFTLVASAP
jgi:hypothetical protein